MHNAQFTLCIVHVQEETLSLYAARVISDTWKIKKAANIDNGCFDASYFYLYFILLVGERGAKKIQFLAKHGLFLNKSSQELQILSQWL